LKGRKTIKINLNEDKNKHCRYTNTEVINPRDPNPVPIKKKKLFKKIQQSTEFLSVNPPEQFANHKGNKRR
jgi:hypothetical protein